MSDTDTTTDVRTYLSTEEAMNFLFPGKQANRHLRLFASGPSSTSQDSFRRYENVWRSEGGHKPGDGMTFDQWISTNRWASAGFSPLLTTTPVEGSLAPVSLVWQKLSCQLVEPTMVRDAASGLPKLSNQVGVDVDAAAEILTRVALLPIAPHLVISSGDVIAPLWRLSESLVELAAVNFAFSAMRISRCMHALALKTGSSIADADEPQRTILPLPGSRNAALGVDIVAWRPDPTVATVPMHDLEAWASSEA